MNLSYSLQGAGMAGELRHAQTVMKELGITYQHATPQSINDTWQFWNCENVPDPLPHFLSEYKMDPMKMIGWGLTREVAERLVSNAPTPS
jgi:hypothetical protein